MKFFKEGDIVVFNSDTIVVDKFGHSLAGRKACIVRNSSDQGYSSVVTLGNDYDFYWVNNNDLVSADGWTVVDDALATKLFNDETHKPHIPTADEILNQGIDKKRVVVGTSWYKDSEAPNDLYDELLSISHVDEPYYRRLRDQLAIDMYKKGGKPVSVILKQATTFIRQLRKEKI